MAVPIAVTYYPVVQPPPQAQIQPELSLVPTAEKPKVPDPEVKLLTHKHNNDIHSFTKEAKEYLALLLERKENLIWKDPVDPGIFAAAMQRVLFFLPESSCRAGLVNIACCYNPTTQKLTDPELGEVNVAFWFVQLTTVLPPLGSDSDDEKIKAVLGKPQPEIAQEFEKYVQMSRPDGTKAIETPLHQTVETIGNTCIQGVSHRIWDLYRALFLKDDVIPS